MATLTSPMASHMNGKKKKKKKMKIEYEPDGRRQSSQNDDLVFNL